MLRSKANDGFEHHRQLDIPKIGMSSTTMDNLISVWFKSTGPFDQLTSNPRNISQRLTLSRVRSAASVCRCPRFVKMWRTQNNKSQYPQYPDAFPLKHIIICHIIRYYISSLHFITMSYIMCISYVISSYIISYHIYIILVSWIMYILHYIINIIS